MSYQYCHSRDFCLEKGVKFEKYVSVLQNNGVKKLVRPADILKRPTYFFFFYTLHIDGTNHRTNGINSQTILKFNEFSCYSRTGHLVTPEDGCNAP